MDNLDDLGITKIMEISKEGIWNVFVVENNDIRGMIIHYGNNIYKMRIRILNPRLGSMLLLWNIIYPLSQHL
jgi:hypothetical protein